MPHAGRGAAWAAAVVVAAGRFVAFAEGVELIGEGQHEIAGQRVIFYVVDVVGGYRAADAGFLLEQVIDFQHHCCRSVAQELIGYGGVPQPLVHVVAFGISRRGGEVEVGGENEAEWRIP